MDGYWQIYMLIFVLGVLSGISSRKNIINNIVKYTVLYYIVTSIIRTMQGNKGLLLGGSFVGKTVTGYGKAFAILILTYVATIVAKKVTKKAWDNFFNSFSVIYCIIHILIIVFVGIPSLGLVTIVSICAMLVSIGLTYANRNRENKKSEVGQAAGMLICSVAAWLMVYVVLGPAEIYAFSSDDFYFTFSSFFTYMVCFAIVMLICVGSCALFLFEKKQNTLLSIVILGYTVLSYIQTMFFNTGMNDMEGAEDTWAFSKIVGNAAIWIILTAMCCLVLYLANKKKKLTVVICFLALFIVALQMMALVSVLMMKDVVNNKKPVVSKEGEFDIGVEDNIIIIMLDSYGTQMMDLVLEENPDFLEPLNDFTYYYNMQERFEHTVQSIPYMFTGVLKEEYDYDEDHRNSTFFKEIKSYGYDIKLYTSNFLAANFGDGVITNVLEDTMAFDAGEVVKQMIDCCRYRSLPFVLKNVYTYSTETFNRCISSSDVEKPFIWGDDREFYLDMKENGVNVDESIQSALRFYHLRGAHSAYFLRENIEYGDEQDPMAQWRACMLIAYGYIEELKKIGKYDDSTIIIMADHGPNEWNRENIYNLFGIKFDDLQHPLFIMKRKNETHNELIVDYKDTSHDDFEGTIIKSIDESNQQYGKSVWE